MFRFQIPWPVLSAHIGLFFLLLAFFWLATLHSLVVPVTQGEDELAHYRYLSFIAQHGRLPATPEEREAAWYRSDWPPLYHLLVGGIVSPLDTTQSQLKDVGESPRRRLVGEIFYPRLIIYTEDANWPWQGGILAWHIGRFISILFATVALIFTYLTALELLRSISWSPKIQTPNLVLRLSNVSKIALAATALLAFTPRYLFTSAMLGDDSLFILLSALFIWLLLRALRGADSWWLYGLLGLLLGLSLTTKYSTGLFPLALIPVIVWRARQAGWGWKGALGRLAFAWLWTLIGASWWFGWIMVHFNTVEADGWFSGLLSPLLASGPDVSMRRVFAFLGGEGFSGALRPGAVAEGTWAGWWTYLFQTFWGVPVLEVDPLYPWAYLPLLLLCLLALWGLWQLWPQIDAQTRLSLALLGFIVILLLPFPILRFFLTYNILETGQGRHILYPAAQAIPILLVLGWLGAGSRAVGGVERRETPHQGQAGKQGSRGALRQAQDTPQDTAEESKPHAPRTTHHALRITPYALRPTPYIPLLLLIWSIFQLGYMSWIYPDPLPVRTTTFRQEMIPVPLKHNFSEEIQLLGYDYQPEPEQGIINLTLFWQAREVVEENYRVRVRLTDPEGETFFTWLSQPVNGLYPTRAWDQGDVIRDTLPLPLAALPARAYDLQLDLVREAEMEPLNPEPLNLIHFELVTVPPIPGAATLAGYQYRLWGNDKPLRPRQTLALSWRDEGQLAVAAGSDRPTDYPPAEPAWVLTGPDGRPRPPLATGPATALFMIGTDWPSGDYRLGLAGAPDKSEPLVTVNNDFRLFELPAELAAQPGWTPVEANFAGQIKLMGYHLPTRRVEPGGSLPLSLAWQSLQPVLPDALTFAVLLAENQEAFGSVDRYPSGFYSPILWAEGEVVPDTFSLAVHPEAPPGVYFLHLGLYHREEGQPTSLPLVVEGQTTDQTAVVIGPIKVGGAPPGVTVARPQPQIRLDQKVGDGIKLLGYDLEIEQPGQNPAAKVLKLTLYWQAEAAVQADYTTFLHLRNPAGETVAQKDGPPAGGSYPSSLWEQGETIVDQITLPLDGVEPGHYAPTVGLYELETGLRLPVPGNPANEIRLKNVSLQ